MILHVVTKFSLERFRKPLGFQYISRATSALTRQTEKKKQAELKQEEEEASRVVNSVEDRDPKP